MTLALAAALTFYTFHLCKPASCTKINKHGVVYSYKVVVGTMGAAPYMQAFYLSAPFGYLWFHSPACSAPATLVPTNTYPERKSRLCKTGWLSTFRTPHLGPNNSHLEANAKQGEVSLEGHNQKPVRKPMHGRVKGL